MQSILVALRSTSPDILGMSPLSYEDYVACPWSNPQSCISELGVICAGFCSVVLSRQLVFVAVSYEPTCLSINSDICDVYGVLERKYLVLIKPASQTWLANYVKEGGLMV